MSADKILLVDGKRVAIIQAYTHTYHVRFLKTGKVLEVHKSYVKSWKPTAKKKTVKKIKPKSNIQTSIKF